jgi:hypothetical protein
MAVARGLLMVTTCGVLLATPTKVAGKAGTGLGNTVGSGKAVPVPLRLTVGVAAALLTMARAALRAPKAPGVKVMMTSQVALAATAVVVLQVPVRTKSSAAKPVMSRALMFSGALPLFNTVKLRGALLPRPTLPKFNALTPPKSMPGAGAAVAVPSTVTEDEVPGAALCDKPTVPVKLPAAVGAKRTTMVQVEVGVSVVVLVQLESASRVNNPGPIVSADKVRLAVPVFCTVKVLVPEPPTVAEMGKLPAGVI